MPLLRKVDCVRLYVPDLEAGLAFYRDKLGHELIWRTKTAAGLRLPETDAELVIQTEDQRQEVDLLVDSADEAATFIEQAGGKVIVPPFDIQVGRCVVVTRLASSWKQSLGRSDIGRVPPVDDRIKAARQHSSRSAAPCGN